MGEVRIVKMTWSSELVPPDTVNVNGVAFREVNYDRIAMSREVWWYPYKDGTFRALLRGARLLFGKRFWQR